MKTVLAFCFLKTSKCNGKRSYILTMLLIDSRTGHGISAAFARANYLILSS